MDGADGVAFGSAGAPDGPRPDGGGAFSAELAQAKLQHAVVGGRLGLGNTGMTSPPANTTSHTTAFAGVAAVPAFGDATVFAPAAGNSASLGDLAGGLPRSTLGAAGGGFLTGMFALMPHSPAPRIGAIPGQKLTYTYNPDEGTLSLQSPGTDGQPNQTLATVHMGLNGMFTTEAGQSVAALNPDGSLQFDRNYLGSLAKTPPAATNSPATRADLEGFDEQLSGVRTDREGFYLRPDAGNPLIETFPISADAGRPLIETFPVSPDAGNPLIETFPVSPDAGKSLIETFPGDQNNGPTILEARAQPPVTERPAPAGSPEGTRSYEVGQNRITLTPQPGGTYKADVAIKEDFGDVVRSSATKQVGADARTKGEDGDVGFHTIAHRFFPGLTETIVPGNGALNSSGYRTMENEIGRAVAKGHTVTGTIEPLPEDSARPQALSVALSVRDHAGNMLYPIRDIFANKAR